MNVLVTAAGGFLGAPLCTALLGRAHEVIGVDQRLVPAGITHLIGRTYSLEFSNALKNLDAIVHLEWSGSVRHAMADPGGTRSKNHGMVEKIIGLAKATSSRLVFASTGIVYGGNLPRSTEEREDPSPRTDYGRQKREAEAMVRESGVGVSVRLFNLYGPGPADPAQIIPRLIAAAVTRAPVNLTGDGGQVRDFIHVDDAVQALVKFVEAGTLPAGEFNVGSGQGYSMLQLAEKVFELAGEIPSINFAPPVPGESRNLVANIEKAKSSVGFDPRVTMEAGLTNLIEIYGAQIALNNG